MGTPSTIPPLCRLAGLCLLGLLFPAAWGQTAIQATTVPLVLPGGLAYDSAGNLYFAETARHVVRRVSSAGILTVVAGTGTQGFGGDGGAATAALLDSPAAVAVDAAGDLLIADTHNHRIRRVDALSGTITTVAGTGLAGTSANGTAAASAAINLPVALAIDPAGDLYFADAAAHLVRRVDATTGLIRTVAGDGVQGFAGDGGSALAAEIDSPWGIAVDVAGDLFLADSHNHRVRRVDAVSGVITTVAGTGAAGFAGDASPASGAKVNLPGGLALDAGGNLWIVDSLNHRIRRIDASSGQIETIAGDGTQGFAGDGGAAAAAALDTPRAVVISAEGLPVFSDSANGRVREVDSAALIHTLAGLGTTGSATLSLFAPSVVLYGTGAVTATLVASPASGSITFFDTPGSSVQPVSLGSVALATNTAIKATTALRAGTHSLTATYAGDATHSPAASGALALMVAPAAANAAIVPVTVLYGQQVPPLTAALNGILAQDSGIVTLALSTFARSTSPPGAYPIAAMLTGTAAGNYALKANAAAVTIAKAPAAVALPANLGAQVTSTTSGTPTGIIDLLDGGNLYATAPVTASGTAAFSASALSAGTHTLTALYGGDANFLTGASAPLIVTIGGAGTPDFTLASNGASSVAVPAGSPATFSFSVAPLNGALSSPILLTATGLPTGATASFNPATLPPGSAPTSFTLTIETVKLAQLRWVSPLIFAAILPVFAWRRRRFAALVLSSLLLIAGCGDRINQASTASTSASYNVTVLATATSATGATLQHSAAVTLTLE